ncbi:MAP7 domain-containing protein 3 [Mus musculus]|uniref:MAP7 domain-containing protein 3 n=1 Tax=Mus musculus TaxID=10090 RepID=MA7D3_MOUSE|nr:MAP7 domain-containing protein 3 [Mus musculus]A2AEY4.1 RecName: Full=MAP7 domain-containing protein 3 [Mus musculus]|eukprot:NP_796267.2 MAP7 domain-containing protein 3 [Mus musculus]
MADPTFAATSSSTSFRGLHERLVAMTQELAEERRHKRGINSSAGANKRSSSTPDGSVLKNDVKQQLAKERREQQKRQQEANKEKQLLEKEQKAKLQYEKQLEEKHRKLKEQKEKDQRRQASAEEKRKQKQAEDTEKFKAVVSRTLERCNRIDQRQKRWSWEGGVMNADKSGKLENKRSSSLSRKDNRLHPRGDMQHVDNTPGMTKYVFRYVTAPVFSSDEIKSSAMFCKPSAKTPVAAKLEKITTKKLDASLRGHVEGLSMMNIEIPPKITIEVPSPPKLEESSEADAEVRLQTMDDISKVKEDASQKVDIKVPTDENIARHPKPNVEELSPVSVDTSSSVELSSIVSVNSSPSLSTGSFSFGSVEISPVVSIDASLETNIDTSPELSMDSGNTKVASEIKTEAPLQARGESRLEASVEGQPEANVEGSPKNPEIDKRNINLTTKKQPLCHIPCYRWPSSSALGCRPPSPLKALQTRKIRPPSPIPVSSKLSTKTSLSYKITPVQNVLYVPNSLGVIATKKETIQKYPIKKEFGNRSMPSAEAIKKAFIQIRHAAYEQSKNEKERLQKEETKQRIARKPEIMAEKLDKVPAEGSLPCQDEQQDKNPTKTFLESPEVQKAELQKGDSAMMKSRDSAEQRKKEQENILQHWQERLERRKASEISFSSEDEADDEGESEDSLEIFPSGGKMLSMKLKKFHKYAKTKPQKLVFLQSGTDEVDTNKNVYFNGDMKAVKQKDPKYSMIQGKGSKLSAKKPPTRPIRSRKTKEGSTAIRPTQSASSNPNHKWVCDKVIDFNQTPFLKTTLTKSNKESPADSKIACQGPQAHLDHRKRTKSVSVPLTNVLSHLHITGRASNLEHPFASVYSRLAFGKEAEESDV